MRIPARCFPSFLAGFAGQKPPPCDQGKEGLVRVNRLKEEGIALVITLLVMTLLLIMGTAFLSISSTETLISINERKRLQAFHLAEAGAEWAIATLNLDGGYGGTTKDQPLGPDGASDPIGTYSVTVCPPVCAGAPPGSPTQRIITATGCVYDCGTPSSARAQVEVVVEEEASPFQFAMLGMESVNLDDRVVVDSYDSTLGDYDSDTAGAEGHIHSNGDIILRKDNTVNGNAQAGGSGSCGGGNQIGDPLQPCDPVDPADSITEGVSPVTVVTDISYPAYNSDPAGISPPGAYDTSTYDLTVNPDQIVTLDPGTYSFNRITLGTNATLDVTGPVTIYMTGKFNAQGGAEINASEIPTTTNLLIFSSVSGVDAIKMEKGGGKFYGAIYARDGEVEFNGGGWKIYGAILADKIRIKNDARFHYDVALARAKFRPSAGTWRELFP